MLNAYCKKWSVRLIMAFWTAWWAAVPAAANEKFSLSDSATAAVPVGCTLETYRSDDGSNLEQLFVIWLDPSAGYSLYAPDSPGGSPLRLKITPPFSPPPSIFYLPGQVCPDPLDPDAEVLLYSRATPIFIFLPGYDASVELELLGLLCSSKNCIRFQKKWSLDPASRSSYEQLPLAAMQPWWEEFKNARKLAMQPSEYAENMRDREADKSADDATLIGSLAKSEGERIRNWKIKPDFTYGESPKNILTVLFTGLLAGFLLNFMPCSFPVVALKLSAFISGGGGEDEKKRLRNFQAYNIFFTLGVLAWFGIAGIILMGGQLMWGQLFQSPFFITLLLLILFLLSLSLYGFHTLPVLHLGSGAPQSSGRASPRRDAFTMGFLATVLATPCSGPLLGAVLGIALYQSPLAGMVIFLSVGTGMAFPYILLACCPGLSRFFPRPGAWLQKAEMLVAVFSLAVCFYLLFLLPPVWKCGAGLLMLGAVFLAAFWGQILAGKRMMDGRETSFFQRTKAAWRTGVRLQRANPRLAPQWQRLFISVILLGGLFVWIHSGEERREEGWVSFEVGRFERIWGERDIFVDFTADWCINCKVLEKTVLSSSNLGRWRKEYGAMFMKVDLSRENRAGQVFLESLGGGAIPFAALFPAGEGKDTPIILRDMFTTREVEAAFKKAINGADSGRR